jgi:hypothetical protein
MVRVRPKPLPPRVTAEPGIVQALGSEAIWRDYLQVSPISSAA